MNEKLHIGTWKIVRLQFNKFVDIVCSRSRTYVDEYQQCMWVFWLHRVFTVHWKIIQSTRWGFLLVLKTNLYPNKIIKPIRNATNVYLGANRRLLFTHLWLGQIIDNRNFNILRNTFVDFLTLHIHHFSDILSNIKKKHHLCQLEYFLLFRVEIFCCFNYSYIH